MELTVFEVNKVQVIEAFFFATSSTEATELNCILI